MVFCVALISRTSFPQQLESIQEVYLNKICSIEINVKEGWHSFGYSRQELCHWQEWQWHFNFLTYKCGECLLNSWRLRQMHQIIYLNSSSTCPHLCESTKNTAAKSLSQGFITSKWFITNNLHCLPIVIIQLLHVPNCNSCRAEPQPNPVLIPSSATCLPALVHFDQTWSHPFLE